MIIPGILENSLEEIQNKIDLIQAEAKRFQIDIADGILVDGETYKDAVGLGSIKSPAQLELHLMVQNPLPYLEHAKDVFTHMVAHVEAENIAEFIDTSFEMGFKTGLSINLNTPIAELEYYIPKIDYVQFMSIVPGGQGRPFEPKVLEKIKEFKKAFPAMETQVDGHMNEETIALVKKTEVDNFIVGSAIFNDAHPVEMYKELEKLVEG